MPNIQEVFRFLSRVQLSNMSAGRTHTKLITEISEVLENYGGFFTERARSKEANQIVKSDVSRKCFSGLEIEKKNNQRMLGLACCSLV